ncbi:MAG: hypothetical protein ABI192_14220 [Bradyrhizobium sp.]
MMTALSFNRRARQATISRRNHLSHFENQVPAARGRACKPLIWQAQNESRAVVAARVAGAARDINPGCRGSVFVHCAIEMKESARLARLKSTRR